MGSAMAPAAADTIKQHLEDLGRTPDDYDLILTGDLSGVGSPILKDLLKEEGINVGTKHNDCGLMIYTPDQ
ncbi:stage V sporulation protein AD, partial [Bacillus licheniformis]|nr:stage V sporulation protein AD [Bacillus licheniformis]